LVSIVPRSNSRILTDAVVYVPIYGDAPRALIGLAHRRGDRSPGVQNFVTVARSAMRAVVQSKSNDDAKKAEKANAPRD
jgi:hypothetical protein